jgi:hypothetical protein
MKAASRSAVPAAREPRPAYPMRALAAHLAYARAFAPVFEEDNDDRKHAPDRAINRFRFSRRSDPAPLGAIRESWSASGLSEAAISCCSQFRTSDGADLICSGLNVMPTIAQRSVSA